MNNKPVVGFIGLGLMGSGMAKNILKGGYELWVKGNNNRQSVEMLIALGAKESESAKAMAERCDVIHLCLSNSAQVEDIFRRPDGILAGARPGLIVVDTSTADPGSTIRLAEELAARGADMLDAPLGRTPREAEAGTLDAIVGGDPAILERARPVIECWTGSIHHVGSIGSGHKMKLLMNFISLSYAALYSEVAVLGAKVGISPEALRGVIAPSRLGNGFFDTFMRYVVDGDRDAHKFSISNAAKDLRYINNMASDANVVNVMAGAARHYYTHAEATGHGSDYVPMLSDHVAALNGVSLSTGPNP